MSTETHADIRDMYMAHTVFRREFGLLPAAISNVPTADVTRAQVVAQHYELIHEMLHHHHQAEDIYLFPRLVGRTQEAPPIVAALEAQHEELDNVLADLTAGVNGWRETADPAQGARLAETAGRLSGLLDDHMNAEEEQAMALIAQHITTAEYGEMVAVGAAGVKPDDMMVLFGMVMYEGDPEVIKETIDHMPDEIRPGMAERAAGAFARHSELVHGTPTPPKSTEL
jgi:hemerythrin-like domain-containing protein